MPIYSDHQIDAAYQHCLSLTKSHYENFPVASLLLPEKTRYPIAAIYAFARTADDFADEGNLKPEERINALSEYEQELDRINLQQTSDNQIFIALRHSIEKHQLPLQLFRDLLSAFKQDVNKVRYQNISEVIDYCRRSANPVGRLLLHLYGKANQQNVTWSDSICTALQLINFLQDIHQDMQENNRIYIPVDEMQKYAVTEKHLLAKISDQNMGQLFKYQLDRAQRLILEGAPLGQYIDGRFGLQLRLMIAGGLAVCKRLEQLESDYFERPRLRSRDWFSMFKYAIIRSDLFRTKT